MNDYTSYVGFGVAGNFALHLEQAGESADFKDILTEDPNGPKGMFPFYIPGREGQLGIYPISSDTILLSEEECNVQLEPEVALICDLEYDVEGNVTNITPRFFGAYNDCSLRKEGSEKISHKKNWGEASKGLSSTLIPIDTFEKGGVMDSYRIASFLRREGMLIRYGEDVELTGYSFFYRKLLEWMQKQINTQSDFGPLEPIGAYLREAGCPKQAIISIGATRYTHFGETNFLEQGDEVIVVVYDNKTYCMNPILSFANKGVLAEKEGVSALVQKVIRA
ncbi:MULTISPECIES: DUF5718 family protein [unclassified Sulfuricurvum]|uniref:DUF5718 family protein n=1 Tax=unclassified Sulfuricurvum TaxID=2632390 RepID=UPI000299734D|nr:MULTISPECIES: DUF5718 family protein [unclassified Sulfuricurvum]AFV96680.1 hypothetical protein B649_01830 [Candidatus Sulfuricurvum sp. RIFRC-1]HBM36131.1 hypothetical protein [Sulfuricurvum sp.]